MISEKENIINNELIYTNRIMLQLGLVDRLLFLINRLYKNFNDGLKEARQRNGSYDLSFEDNIENEDFLNKYGNFRLKKEILKILNNKITPNIVSQYYSKELRELSTKKKILINNKEHLIIAPFLYDIRSLKKIIIHELALSKKENIEKQIFYIKSILSELILRINHPYSWDLLNEEYRTFEIDNLLFWNAYTENWEDSGEPDYNQIEIAELIGVKKRETINLNDFIVWLDSINIKEIETLSKKQSLINNHCKLLYNKSPLKLKELIITFFNIQDIEIDEDRKSRIGRFIVNCFEIKTKYSVSSQNYETINFLNKKTLLPFVSLLIYLHKKECLNIKSSKYLSDILISELKHINQPYIGLSNQLRNKISQDLMNKPIIELTILTGFKQPSKINKLLIN